MEHRYKAHIAHDLVRQQTRHWLEMMRERSETLVADARVSLNADIEWIYGDVTAECLSSERGLVQYILRFANGVSVRSKADEMLATREAIKAIPPDVGRVPDLIEITAIYDEVAEPQLLKRRMGLRSFLSAVLSDVVDARTRFGEGASRAWELLWVLPIRTPYGVSRESHMIVPDREAFGSLIASLFLDDQRTFARDLRQCRYTKCGNFFLTAPRRGNQKTYYCSEGCRDNAHNAGGATRMRNLRGKRARKHK